MVQITTLKRSSKAAWSPGWSLFCTSTTGGITQSSEPQHKPRIANPVCIETLPCRLFLPLAAEGEAATADVEGDEAPVDDQEDEGDHEGGVVAVEVLGGVLGLVAPVAVG